MTGDRLELSLELLKPSDWARFEKLASVFLSDEFEDLRTVASPAGDGGRDSELFSPQGEPNVLLQYSVTSEWSDKIVDTAKRIQREFPEAVLLIYASSRMIGARADGLKRKLRTDSGLSLDVRDRAWFVERTDSSVRRASAAEELARVIVDPYLANRGVSSCPPAALSSPEAIAAVTFLGLQWRDDVRERGLTKLVFEALVRAVLADTDSANRTSRNKIREAISALLPGHDGDQVSAYVDSALRRLTKKALRHWKSEDEFCLMYEEHLRVTEYKTRAAIEEAELLSVISDISATLLSGHQATNLEQDVTARIRRLTDTVVFERSQAFAVAVHAGTVSLLLGAEVTSVVQEEIGKGGLPKIQGIDWVEVLENGVREVLCSEAEVVQTHLRSLSDAYTLLAFLRMTPDVQGAVEKMFSHGKIWLDASVILPVLAESLLESTVGKFTRMLGAARDAGLDLFVTPGVIEEVERHMNRALMCANLRGGTWRGGVPYLLERYIASGRPIDSFGAWLERFRGSYRPEDDISAFLSEELGIETRGLLAERDAADSELRSALQFLWYEAHRNRRDRGGEALDDATIGKLVEHDVECYAGVVQLRNRERNSHFGYDAWWLTVDRQAFDLKGKLQDVMKHSPPDSPVLSADFLVNYLAFGPARRRVGKEKERYLPLMMDLESARYLTPELMGEADKIREKLRDMPERVVRREVRDHFDRARMRLGPIARAGFADPMGV